MKGDKRVIEHLQTALTMELTTVHQYMLHATVLDDWGLGKLADKMRAEMQEELGHAEQFMTRITFLEGDPDAQSLDKVSRAQSLKDMFAADLQGEIEARKFYTKAAHAAIEAGDLGTQDLFHKITLDEEGHIDWLETQTELLERLGERAYFQLYIAPDTAEGEA